MKERKNIFHNENAPKMSSPEQLNDYIKVSNPSIWIILGAIAVILAAFIFWGIFYELPEGISPIRFLIGSEIEGG